MRDTQTAPHDKLSLKHIRSMTRKIDLDKLSAAILANSIRVYMEEKPIDKGTCGSQGRIANWKKNKREAEYFLFKDNYNPDTHWGFACVCQMYGVDHKRARASLIKNKHNLKAILESIEDNANDTLTTKR